MKKYPMFIMEQQIWDYIVDLVVARVEKPDELIYNGYTPTLRDNLLYFIRNGYSIMVNANGYEILDSHDIATHYTYEQMHDMDLRKILKSA